MPSTEDGRPVHDDGFLASADRGDHRVPPAVDQRLASFTHDAPKDEPRAAPRKRKLLWRATTHHRQLVMHAAQGVCARADDRHTSESAERSVCTLASHWGSSMLIVRPVRVRTRTRTMVGGGGADSMVTLSP